MFAPAQPIMSDDAWLLNEWQPKREPPATVGISLSGGGHRAALYAAGAIAAVVDAGLAASVAWFASASGGSLSSGYVLSHGGLANLSSDVDGFVEAALAICTRRLGSAARVSVPALIAQGPGASLEHSLTKLWLQGTSSLESFSAFPSQHIFLAVDLESLQPAYLSSTFVFIDESDNDGPSMGRPGALKLSSAVRASCMFPFLPTVKIGCNTLALYEKASEDEVIVLADGGLWNNLATSWHSEQDRIRRTLHHALPSGLQSPVQLHLVVDASASPRRVSSGALSLPVLGWGRGAWRSYKAMSQSSVTHHRAQLGASAQFNAGGPISHVNLRIDPQVVCNRSALFAHLGADLNRWRSVTQTAKQVPTTLLGMSRDTALAVLGHAYGLTSAHLADGWSIPWNRFSDPFTRFQ